jgi:hypothetical protein
MAIIDLVTIGTVRNLRGWSVDATQDAILGDIITSVSRRFDLELCGRHTLQAARTEQLDVAPGQRDFHLAAFPVDTGATLEFRTSTVRDFSGAAIAAADYYLQANTGRLHFDVPLESGAGALQAIYTGGLSSTASGIESNYPDISDAVRKQVVYEFERRDSLGLGSQTLSNTGAQREWRVMGNGWLHEVWEVIQLYRLSVFV